LSGSGRTNEDRSIDGLETEPAVEIDALIDDADNEFTDDVEESKMDCL
jgi:hypothetical protein